MTTADQDSVFDFDVDALPNAGLPDAALPVREAAADLRQVLAAIVGLVVDEPHEACPPGHAFLAVVRH